MTAITCFGEMLVASVLAIVLLAISPLERDTPVRFSQAEPLHWTISEYIASCYTI
jgi:hypothetical protein